MPLVKDNGQTPEAAKGKKAYMVIWTTTVDHACQRCCCSEPALEYAWVECEGEVLFMAKDLLAQVGAVCHKDLSNILGTTLGKDMEYA